MVSLVVWASPGDPPRTPEPTVLWKAFRPSDPPATWVSLPEHVELNKDVLRRRYRLWLANIAQRDMGGIALQEFMSIHPNLSYWWLTLPTDFSIAVDSPAYRVTRLFALADAAAAMEFDHVKVVADRVEVAKAVELWAKSIGKPVTIEMKKSIEDLGRNRRRCRGPFLAVLRVFWNHFRIALQRGRKSDCFANEKGLVLVDYLAHLQEPGLDGTFRSNYWGPLVEVLDEGREPVTWLHVSPKYATPAVVNEDLKKCRAFNSERQHHRLVHSYVDLRTVGRALRHYMRIRHFGSALLRRHNVFVEMGTGLDPSPLLMGLVEDQYLGRSAALNAIWISLWKSVFDSLPKQRLGIYLFENQPWEMAFLAAWREAGVGRLLAVAHSTMRFWDLRYFQDEVAPGTSGRPFPNEIVVNGPRMKAAATEGGYQEESLLVAETLRHELGMSARTQEGGDVLVLGEYDAGNDKELIDLAKEVAQQLGPEVNTVYRPHPAATMNTGLLPDRWSLSGLETIGAAIANCQVAVCGPTTSAALDASLNGRRVVVVGRADAFISSPAIDLPNSHLITSKVDLGLVTRFSLEGVTYSRIHDAILFNEHLPRWRAILRPDETSGSSGRYGLYETEEPY